MQQDKVYAFKKVNIPGLVDEVSNKQPNDNENTILKRKKEPKSFLYTNSEEGDEESVNGMFRKRRSLTGLEKLLYEIFIINEYNRFVRPVDELGITNIQTQLKLLQIDLVKKTM